MDKKTSPWLGAGKVCPRCLGRKRVGTSGVGIALSRRGRAAICSDCGTEEALIDAKIVKAPFGTLEYGREKCLQAAIARARLAEVSK